MCEETGGFDGKKQGGQLLSVVSYRLLWRALFGATFACSLFAVTAAGAEPAQEDDREKAVAFVNQLRLLIQHGDLADKAGPSHSNIIKG